MNVCPTCNGEKVLHGYGCPGFKPITMECYDCKGTGEVDDVQKVWREHGETLRKFRQARDLSLREAAAWAEVKPSHWSDAEHGRLDPGPLIGRVQQKARAEFQRREGA